MREWILEEIGWKSVRDTKCDVAVLPWGATEAHNLHLPYGTDTIQAAAIAGAAAARAAAHGARVMVLPAIPFGVQTGQLDIPLCINVNPSTQAALLRDIVHSLEAHDVRALVILNGHGGNDFKPILRELQPTVRMLLCTANWWTAVDPGPFFDEPGDHAGELETSVMLHLRPDLVLPLGEAGPGTAHQFRIEAFRKGWAWTQRAWTQVTADTGVGNPRAATAGRGAAFYDAVVARLSAFLVDLARCDPDDMYEAAPTAAQS